MSSYTIAQSALCSLLIAGLLLAAPPAKVDFASDVQPILRQNCVGCHGPAQQISGLRLDRKSAVLGRRGVVPDSSANSFLFHRVSGNAYGMQMPPTGPLRPCREQSRISSPMDGNATVEALITPQWLPDSRKTRAPCGIRRTSEDCTSNETIRCLSSSTRRGWLT